MRSEVVFRVGKSRSESRIEAVDGSVIVLKGLRSSSGIRQGTVNSFEIDGSAEKILGAFLKNRRGVVEGGFAGQKISVTLPVDVVWEAVKGMRVVGGSISLNGLVVAALVHYASLKPLLAELQDIRSMLERIDRQNTLVLDRLDDIHSEVSVVGNRVGIVDTKLDTMHVVVGKLTGLESKIRELLDIISEIKKNMESGKIVEASNAVAKLENTIKELAEKQVDEKGSESEHSDRSVKNESDESDLPSFVIDNPWVKVLSEGGLDEK